MSFYVLSDLHTDYAQSMSAIPKYLKPWLLDADDLIIAGDISTNFFVTVETLKYLGTIYKNVYWVPGNHDYVPYINGRVNYHSFDFMETLKRACDFEK
jgi:metallophosphoesterase superfamily enzyme